MIRARLALLVFATALIACRKKTPPAPTPSGSTSTATSANGAPNTLRFERFVAARTIDPTTIEVAAITRDRKVVLTRLDAQLNLRSSRELATGFEAFDHTEIRLLPGGLVTASGRLGGVGGTFLLRDGASALPLAVDNCQTAEGVAWLVREPAGVRVRYVRATKALDVTSGTIAVPADSESHLSCGRDAVALSVRDGERLSIARLGPDDASFSSAPALIEMEAEGELDDELRDRTVLLRAGRGVVVVRVGADHVSVRELIGETGPEKWVTHDAALDEATDVVEVVAAPNVGGPIYLLASEQMKGSCPDGEPPRRIVLHELRTDGPKAISKRRPVVELACGVEAIGAHLEADATRARMWWTEPAEGCTHPGLTVGAVVDAASDRPGARRVALMAEGIAKVDDRFLAVVRTGGCAPWDAAGNGALSWAPAFK